MRNKSRYISIQKDSLRSWSWKESRGSLTIEACIVFPVFICFFIFLLAFVRFACASIALDHAVSETAKQLAASCYPVSFLNELEDELAGESTDSPLPYNGDGTGEAMDATIEAAGDIFGRLLAGEFGSNDATDIFRSIGQDAVNDFNGSIREYLVNKCMGRYFEVRHAAGDMAVRMVMQKLLEGSPVDSSEIEYLLVGLPCSEVEYVAREDNPAYSEACEEIGCVPGRDDVIVAVEYGVRVPIPFFSRARLVIRKIALERAWINGSNGVYTEWDVESEGEGGRLPDDEDTDNFAGESWSGILPDAGYAGEAGQDGYGWDNGTNNDADGQKDNERNDIIVYITKTGRKYHRDGCLCLRRSRIPINKQDAEEKGYSQCRICYENGGKIRVSR